MGKLNWNMDKEEVIQLVDYSGELYFTHWYKNMLHYRNRDFVVTIVPEYRDECGNVETLSHLLCCEDCNSVTVFEGKDKPFKSEWYKRGGE